MSKVFSKLPTSFTDYDLFREKPYDRGHALADLSDLAAYAPHDISIQGHRVHLEKGEFAAATRYLAERWGWSVAKVHEFLARIQADGRIVKVQNGKANGRPSVFRVVITHTSEQGDATEANAQANGFPNGWRTVGERSMEVREGREGSSEEVEQRRTTEAEVTTVHSPSGVDAPASRTVTAAPTNGSAAVRHGTGAVDARTIDWKPAAAPSNGGSPARARKNHG